MIQFNLLPDIKVQYIKARRARQIVTLVAIIVTAVSLVLLGLAVSVKLYQNNRLASLNEDINKNSKALQNIPELNKILTVQNQLNSLTKLHDEKPAVSRLFTYVNQVTPPQAKISQLEIDFTTYTIKITGVADALSSVNKYIDTLKFTEFTTVDAEPTKAFSDIVLTDFSLIEKAENPSERANYTITLLYDPQIFLNNQDVKLNIPSIDRNSTELFTQQSIPNDAEDE